MFILISIPVNGIIKYSVDFFSIPFLLKVISTVFPFVVFNAFIKLCRNLVKALVNLIPGGGAITKWLGDLGDKMKGWLDIARKWCKDLTDSISRTFESAEDRSKRYAEEIANNQDKIYDNQQKSQTLTPLIEEYANKIDDTFVEYTGEMVDWQKRAKTIIAKRKTIGFYS